MRSRTGRALLVCIAGGGVGGALFLVAGTAGGQTPVDVPGVVVHRLPVPTLAQRLLGKAVYTASPCVAVLPDGAYVVSSNLFGRGSGADVSGTTLVHRSRDCGATWEHLTTLRDMKRGSLFVLGEALYIWGYRAAPGDIVIRKSTDGGETWTTSADDRSGLLRRGKYGGTPCNPVVHAKRLWVAVGGRQAMSAPTDADLLRADAWTLSNAADVQSGPLGSGLVVTEAQIVASPRTGVVLLPKIKGKAYTVLIRVGDNPGTVRDPEAGDWVPLPGGEKKFAAGYDSESDTFYVLSNPVLSEYADRGWPPELVRNTAALLRSKNLKTWRTDRVFLQSPNVDYEAFQYLNFAIDGRDLVVASRTAFAVGGGKPPRGHDSNLITFHRLAGFRDQNQREK